MTAPDPTGLLPLMRIIAAGDVAEVVRILDASPDLATARISIGASRTGPGGYLLETIGRYVYAGHTALHVAAAAYRPDIVQALLAKGADARAANRRGVQPLHEAAAGNPESACWNPEAQVATIKALVAAGADVSASSKEGATPLHRSVRTRCAAAVAAGADPRRRNNAGSTALKLARLTTGRGGTGSPAAKDQQAVIIALLDP